MDLYPAIDLRGGRCVRLRQGDYSQETVYGDDPVAVARSFADAGAQWIHVVDLDAARSGVATNREVIGAIAQAVRAQKVRVQSGGGVRSHDAARALFDVGVARVVIGTAAVEEPALVSVVATAAPAGGVAVGIDARRLADGSYEVAVRGWAVGAGRGLIETVRSLEGAGAAAVVVTEIGRDGMLTGPDLEGLGAVLAETEMSVIASGGVSSLADLVELAALERAGRVLGGAIAGKAIYEHRFTVAEALAALSAAPGYRG